MKATRKVDTVIVEMDISTAEKLTALIGAVTYGRDSRDLWELRDLLVSQAEVRSPSPLWETICDYNGLEVSRRLT